MTHRARGSRNACGGADTCRSAGRTGRVRRSERAPDAVTNLLAGVSLYASKLQSHDKTRWVKLQV